MLHLQVYRDDEPITRFCRTLRAVFLPAVSPHPANPAAASLEKDDGFRRCGISLLLFAERWFSAVMNGKFYFIGIY